MKVLFDIVTVLDQFVFFRPKYLSDNVPMGFPDFPATGSGNNEAQDCLSWTFDDKRQGRFRYRNCQFARMGFIY